MDGISLSLSLSLSSPLKSVDKYHPMFTNIEIQNVHHCLINYEFPNQVALTP
jgi:hypothetical protein